MMTFLQDMSCTVVGSLRWPSTPRRRFVGATSSRPVDPYGRSSESRYSYVLTALSSARAAPNAL